MRLVDSSWEGRVDGRLTVWGAKSTNVSRNVETERRDCLSVRKRRFRDLEGSSASRSRVERDSFSLFSHYQTGKVRWLRGGRGNDTLSEGRTCGEEVRERCGGKESSAAVRGVIPSLWER